MNLHEKFTEITAYYSPKVIGEVNDVYVKLAKIKGDEVPWHNHEQEDELFYVIKGSLWFEVEGASPFTLKEGELFIVKKGVNHRVSAEDECHIMLIEHKSTLHTGDLITPITKSIQDQIA